MKLPVFIQSLLLFLVLVNFSLGVSIREAYRRQQAARFAEIAQEQQHQHEQQQQQQQQVEGHVFAPFQQHNLGPSSINIDHHQVHDVINQDHRPYYDESQFAHLTPMVPTWQGHGGRSRNRRMKGIVINEPDEQSRKQVHNEKDFTPEPIHSNVSDEDYEIPVSPPARNRNQERRKGKEVASSRAPLQFYDQTSDSNDEDNLHIQVQNMQLNVQGGRKLNKSGRERKIRAREEGSRRSILDQKRNLFQQEWNRLGLNPEMTAIQLADKAVLIKVPGLTNMARGKFAAAIVRSFEKEPQYYSKFQARTTKLQKHAYQVWTEWKNDPTLVGVDPEVLKDMALERAIHFLEYQDANQGDEERQDTDEEYDS